LTSAQNQTITPKIDFLNVAGGRQRHRVALGVATARSEGRNSGPAYPTRVDACLRTARRLTPLKAPVAGPGVAPVSAAGTYYADHAGATQGHWKALVMATTEAEPVELIPLSHLLLDLDPPVDGIDLELTRRGVPVVLDDLGRRAVSAEAARMLLAGQAEAAERGRELARRREEEAAAAHRPHGGVPAIPGATAFESMLVASPPDRPGRRVSVLEDALAHGGTILHPIREEQDDQ
jgi:hypothetical protein